MINIFNYPEFGEMTKEIIRGEQKSELDSEVLQNITARSHQLGEAVSRAVQSVDALLTEEANFASAYDARAKFVLDQYEAANPQVVVPYGGDGGSISEYVPQPTLSNETLTVQDISSEDAALRDLRKRIDQAHEGQNA